MCDVVQEKKTGTIVSTTKNNGAINTTFAKMVEQLWVKSVLDW